MDEPRAVETVDTFGEFTKLIERTCKTELILFRGMAGDYPLIPRIARVTRRDDTGKDFVEFEKIMLADFKRQSRPFIESVPENDWDWLALAQHHGMATRLLDWSTNPLAALWFSVREAGPEDGVVWIFCPPARDVVTPLNIKKWNVGPFAGERTGLFQPNCVTKRIIAQRGWFTVHKYLAEEKRFVPLEKNRHYKSLVTKVRIPNSAFRDMRYQLDRFGVNHASLFPDVDGISNYVEWLHTRLADEFESSDQSTVQSSKKKVPLTVR